MQRRTMLVFILALLLILQARGTTDDADAAPEQPEGWVTLMSEGFEGVFPSVGWHIGRTGDPYLWGQRNCNPHTGTYSMWGGGGGSLGAQIPCTGMYTTGYATTLSYGPLNLSGCTDLRLNFAHWTQLGAGDSLGVGYSIDGGTVWHLLPITGDAVSACGGWCQESFYQNRWTIPLCGQPKVYLLFRFASNATGVGYGTFVDDVLLEAYYGATSPTATPTATRTTTPTATPMRTPGASKRIYLPLLLR